MIVSFPNYGFSQNVEEVYEQIHEFLSEMFITSMKDNKYLFKAVVTGVTPPLMTFGKSGLNNFFKYEYSNNPFFQFYGFSPEHVNQLAEKFHLTPKEIQSLQRNYNGYIGYSKDELFQVYNPFSINSLFKILHSINSASYL